MSVPGSHSATTQPPNPAPVSRAPHTPSMAHSRSTSASSTGVDTSKSSRSDRWLVAMSDRPAVAGRRRASARRPRRGRGRSRCSRDEPGAAHRRDRSIASACPTRPARRQRTDDGLGLLALGAPVGVRGADASSRRCPECDDPDRDVGGHLDRCDLEGVAVDQQRVAVDAGRRDASWSMIPHGTPVARCSARWQSRAISSGVPSSPSASAVATSSAALDDSPLPMRQVGLDGCRQPAGRAQLRGDPGDVAPPGGLDARPASCTGSARSNGSSHLVGAQLEPRRRRGPR